MNEPSKKTTQKENPAGPFAEVVFNLPLDGPFSYAVPDHLKGHLEIGARVFASFGPRRLTGYLVGWAETCDPGITVKSLEDAFDEPPVLSAETLNFTRWMAEYYQCSWGEAIASALPSGLDERSEELYSLTEQGNSILEKGEVKGATLSLFELLREKGTLSRKQLQTALQRKFNGVLLSKLKFEGSLESSLKITRNAVDVRNETFVRLRAGTEKAEAMLTVLARSPRQQALYRILMEGEIAISDLKLRDPRYGPALGQLKTKDLVETRTARVRRKSPWDFQADASKPEALPELMPEQKTVCAALIESIEAEKFQTFLLFGVTGSGKTEVYLRCIQRVLDMGKSAILLVPEISLTPQTADRFRKRFGNRIAVLHSGLTRTERYEEWRKILAGEVIIALGARSSIFAPMKNIGVIIVDEEHDSSYKQESTPRYHARDAALMRAREQNATVILGTATPSLESWKNAQSGKYRLLKLTRRVNDRPLPWMQIVDMNKEREERKNFGIFSFALKQAISDRLERSEQVFLFLNRRGTANYIQCKDCGFAFECRHCSVTLTWHGANNTMLCHYCNQKSRIPTECSDCGGEALRFKGYGTQKLEEETIKLFPQARVFRLDRDTAKNRQVFETMRDRLNAQEIDILIGTQMIAKGHDFPNVTLVGAMLADLPLNIPDFRSGERAYQLLTQAAGRAGRGETPGWVIAQANRPDHYIFECARNHDYETYAEKELSLRSQLRYPPFVRAVGWEIESDDEARVQKSARRLGTIFARLIPQFPGTDMLGPAPAVLSKIENKYRWRLLLRAPNSQTLSALLRLARKSEDFQNLLMTSARFSVDVDPVNLL
jgi:primosomal protein N' (replication factor Y) (superfamily II helicase)